MSLNINASVILSYKKHEPPTCGHKTLGFKWYAKRINRWQGSFRLIGVQLRNPCYSGFPQ